MSRAIIYSVTMLLLIFMLHWAEAKSQLKKPSDIYGKVLRIGFPPRNPEEIEAGLPSMGDEFAIPNCVVVVRRVRDGREVKRTKTNRYGCFKITLEPGKYEVEPLNRDPDQPGALDGSQEKVIVWRGFYSKVKTVFDGGW